jgi:hypothetical protein
MEDRGYGRATPHGYGISRNRLEAGLGGGDVTFPTDDFWKHAYDQDFTGDEGDDLVGTTWESLVTERTRERTIDNWAYWGEYHSAMPEFPHVKKGRCYGVRVTGGEQSWWERERKAPWWRLWDRAPRWRELGVADPLVADLKRLIIVREEAKP